MIIIYCAKTSLSGAMQGMPGARGILPGEVVQLVF